MQQVPPTVLVRCFHPIFHTAAGAPVPGSVGSLRRSTDAEVDGAPSGATEQPAGKLGSLQASQLRSCGASMLPKACSLMAVLSTQDDVTKFWRAF